VSQRRAEQSSGDDDVMEWCLKKCLVQKATASSIFSPPEYFSALWGDRNTANFVFSPVLLFFEMSIEHYQLLRTFNMLKNVLIMWSTLNMLVLFKSNSKKTQLYQVYNR